MKDQIIISKINAECAVAVPLFRMHKSHEMASIDGYTVSLTTSEPLAYAIDFGNTIQVFNAEYIEKKCIFVGDL